MQVLLRPSTAHFPSAPGESQMAINTLRAAELLSDDSNFRAGLIPLLAPTSAHLLATGMSGCAVAEVKATAVHEGRHCWAALLQQGSTPQTTGFVFRSCLP